MAAAGTTANVVAAAIAFAMISRRQPFEATRYCLWLFASVNALNLGYLVYSGVFDDGDWAVVIAGLHPRWAWRVAISAAGAIAYAAAIGLGAVGSCIGARRRRVDRRSLAPDCYVLAGGRRAARPRIDAQSERAAIRL